MNPDDRARLLEDYNQLRERLYKLKHFVDANEAIKDLPLEDQFDLRDQLVHMQNYYEALGRRVARHWPF